MYEAIVYIKKDGIYSLKKNSWSIFKYKSLYGDWVVYFPMEIILLMCVH